MHDSNQVESGKCRKLENTTHLNDHRTSTRIFLGVVHHFANKFCLASEKNESLVITYVQIVSTDMFIGYYVPCTYSYVCMYEYVSIRCFNYFFQYLVLHF